MDRLPCPAEFVPGDQITFDGRIATRGRFGWTWAASTRLEHLLNVVFARWSDALMLEFLEWEWPDAYVCHHGDRSGR